MLNALQDEPERGGRWQRVILGVLVASVMQGGALWGTSVMAPQKRERRKPMVAQVVKLKPKPKPEPKVEEPPPPPPEPPPEPPKPKPKKKPKAKPQPKPQAQVPPKVDPPPEPPKAPPPPVTGLTAKSFGTGGKGPVLQLGNTTFGRPKAQLTAPVAEAPAAGPVAREGGAEPSVVVATLKSQVQPRYTPEAIAEGLEGVMPLLITVDEEGAVVSAKVLKSFGFGLDEEAIKAVRQWRYSPQLVNGVPTRVTKRITIKFQLED